MAKGKGTAKKATKKAVKKTTKKVAKKTTKKAAKKVAKKTAKKAPKRATKKATKKAAKKTPARAKKATKRSGTRKPKAPATPPSRPGTINHTEFVSTDVQATKQWARKTLGLKFGTPMPTPDGPYEMWDAGNQSGGGIRTPMGPEPTGTIPYVEVKAIKSGHARALKNGAKEMLPPMQIGGGHGWMSIVMAPGNVTVGLWAPK